MRSHKETLVWKNDRLRIEVEPSEIPWLKVFTVIPYREMSDLPLETRREIYALLDLIEREMLAYYQPTKINIASFGNYLPHVHWHIMARFETDSFYPEPMWGSRQRESTLTLASEELFLERLRASLERESQGLL